jgi:hypothetical protein
MAIFISYQERQMRKQAVLLTFGVLVMIGGAVQAVAQVKRVQMHIAGYLCGN